MKLGAIMLGLAVIGAGIFGVHQYREHHLSPAVRAAVLAAVGENSSESDITEFLRAAKLASRTKRDEEVVALFDQSVSLAWTFRHEAEKCDAISLDAIREFALAESHAQIAGYIRENTGDVRKSEDYLRDNAEKDMKRGNADQAEYKKCSEALELKKKQAAELARDLRDATK